MSSNKNRLLRYDKAINEALYQKMAQDKSVFVLGQGVKSPWYVGATTKGLYNKFGSARVIDTPVSENAVTGVAAGAAMTGMRPVVIHPRMDFMVYATDQITNEIANWNYMFGGKASPVPIVIRPIINRGGEQGAQHAQALQAWFAHLPGLKVVMPATPYDAKGLLTSAIEDNNPVMYIDDRWLYDLEENVPREIYRVPIGKGAVRMRGKDITIVGISYMAAEAAIAAQELKKDRISAEVIDVRSVKPLDIPLILKSVRKTKRLIIAEAAWLSGSVSAEIAARVASDPQSFKALKSPIKRVTLPDVPAPVSRTLEAAYYINAKDIVTAVKNILKK